MRKIGQKRQSKFIKEAIEIIQSVGGTPAEDRMMVGYEAGKFNVPTKAGNLVVTVPKEHDYTFTCYMKFDEPKRANVLFEEVGKSVLTLNKYSGKYNVHYSDEVNALDLIDYHFNKII